MLSTILLTSLLSAPQSVSGTAMMDGKLGANVAIWFEGVGTPKAVRTQIVQAKKAFKPRLAVVPVGSVVDFPNKDAIFHNVFAEYNAKKFDLGMYPKGQSKNVKFDRPGLVTVLCNMHSDMSAFVMVVNSAHYTITDKAGKFSLNDVPEGTHELRAWHESGRRGTLSVRVGSSPKPITITLQR